MKPHEIKHMAKEIISDKPVEVDEPERREGVVGSHFTCPHCGLTSDIPESK